MQEREQVKSEYQENVSLHMLVVLNDQDRVFYN